MKKRALLSALALCFLAAGCDSKKPADPTPPKPTAAVVPLPPAASANQDAKPAQMAQMDAKPAPKAGNGRKGCKKNQCNVVINVTEGATPCATATPDKLDVYKGNKDDQIRWTIATQGWKFVSKEKGIVWKDSGQRQFRDGDFDGNPNKFKWTDANTDDLEYKYQIHLVNGSKKCDVDPSAVNGADEEAQPVIR